MENRSISPASSVMSLSEMSDFDDSDFDIISSSDSARSRDEDNVEIGHGTDDESENASQPALLLDTEWLGVVPRADSQLVSAADLMPDYHDEPLAASTHIDEDDVRVMSALSQSLDRSTDSIEASTPMNGSIPSLHFVTSPRTNRHPSSILSRSQTDAPPSASNSTIRLAFPDPLTSSAEIAPKLPLNDFSTAEAPVGPAHNEPSALPSSPSSSLSSFVMTPPSPAVDYEGDAVADEPRVPKEIVTPNHAAQRHHVASSRQLTRTVGQHYIPYLPAFILNSLRHRWTASVVVSILALCISGATYIGVPTSNPSRESAPPISTIQPSWSVDMTSSPPYASTRYSPNNKPSSANDVTHAASPNKSFPVTSQVSYSRLRDMSLTLFAPWAAPQGPSDTARRAQKRKRPSEVSGRGEGPKAASTGYKGWLDALRPVSSIDPGLPTLLIDGTSVAKIERRNKGRAFLADTIVKPVHPLSLPINLPDPHAIRSTVVDVIEFIYPTASAVYTALSEDSVALLEALDELLTSIRSQTDQIGTVFARTRSEASYRQNRAKRNARKIRQKGGELIKGFKQTIVTRARLNARDVGEGVQETMSAFTESVRDGFKQRLMVKGRGKARDQSKRRTKTSRPSRPSRGCSLCAEKKSFWAKARADRMIRV